MTEDTNLQGASKDVENCQQINKVSNDPDQVSRALGSTRGLTKIVAEICQEDICSTSAVKGLSLQIIEEVNQIRPNFLTSFVDLNVEIGDSVNPFLQPGAKAALKRAIDARGEKLVVNSALRTIAQQLMLYQQGQDGRCGIGLVARVGNSNHQSGLALDIDDHEGWQPFLEQHGWQWFGPNDPVHFDYQGGDDIRSIAVQAFQRLWNKHNSNDQIAEDGEYGTGTEERLKQSPIEGFGAAVSGDAVKTKTTMRILRLSQPYMEGDDVRKLQQALAKAKLKVDTDGIFGPGTESAVKQFQQQKGLAADGVVGPATYLELGL